MVEAANSSAGKEGVQPAPANVPPAGTTAAQGTGDLLPPPEREAYKPLSLLALFGFIPAALYAVMILVGALIALISRSPWLLPNWTFIIPVVALLICWVARSQILSSEGVLAGLTLTNWGIGLSLFFGLTYGAYSGATYFAIRAQARSYAEGWMRQVQEGNIERAFLLMLPASERPAENAQLHQEIEKRLNRPDAKGGPGPFTTFAQMELVRLMQAGGANAEIQYQGVAAWEYERGGYRVRLRYHVSSPLFTFEALVTAQSTEPVKGQSGARGWYIVPNGTALLKETVTHTARGEALQEQIMMAGKFGHEWVSRFSSENADHLSSYLDTLPPTERRRVMAAMQETESLAPAAGLAPLAGFMTPDLWKGHRAFLKGDWIQFSSQLWVLDEKTKKQIIRAAKNLCHLKPEEMKLVYQPSGFPLVRSAGENGLQLAFDMHLMYRPEEAALPYLIQGYLVLENPTPDVAREDAWRLVGIELTSAHRMQPPRRP